MPGITGIIGPGKHEDRRAELQQMIDCMMHESFYTKGAYVDDLYGFRVGWAVHQAPIAETMPFWNEPRDIGLIFSGENFPDPDEILSLRSKGHEVTPGSSDYLVHLYEESENAFFGKLNGRFSGVIIDLRHPRIVLFNDRYGLNRIYYAEDNDGFYFSSEAKSLLRVLPGLRRLDHRSLGEAFTLGCVLQDRTLFQDIGLLPGGSAWTFYPGVKARKSVYFRPDQWEGQDKLTGQAYYDKLKETWARILPRYLNGNAGVAVSLTGGQDSRMIMAWAKSAPGTLPCYTFGGPYRECRDVNLARRVAGICGQTHRVISVGSAFFAEFPSLADRTVYITDGTMDVSGSVELYVNRLAREIAPIRLSGNYGQEILQSFIAFRPKPIKEDIFQEDFRKALADAKRTYEDELGPNPLSFVAFKQVPWHHFSRLSLELSQLILRSPYLDNDLVALAYQAPTEDSETSRVQLRMIAEGNPALGGLPTDRGVLIKPVPFVTAFKRLVQQFTVNAEYAYDYGMPQWMAKIDSALKPLHAERIFLGRHKFAHFRLWYRDELSGFVKEVLLDPITLQRPFFKRRQLEKLVTEHLKGTGNHTLEIHRLLTAELLCRLFIAPKQG